MPGSQAVFSKGSLIIYIINNILIRVITEILVECRRRELKLPFKFNIFRKEEKRDFVFKYPRFKKRKFKILSRELSLPIIYHKKLVIKHEKMVEPIIL